MHHSVLGVEGPRRDRRTRSWKIGEVWVRGSWRIGEVRVSSYISLPRPTILTVKNWRRVPDVLLL